jgi:hypothetical protein
MNLVNYDLTIPSLAPYLLLLAAEQSKALEKT